MYQCVVVIIGYVFSNNMITSPDKHGVYDTFYSTPQRFTVRSIGGNVRLLKPPIPVLV